MKTRLFAAFVALALSACGDTGSKGSSAPTQSGSSLIEDGKYFLKSAKVDSYSQGTTNILTNQPVQVVGDFSWTIKATSKNTFEATATGTAKFTYEDYTFNDLNCAGARDVYAFEVTESKDIRNIKAIETGCPQGAQLNTAQQLSLDPVSKTAFIVTRVDQGDGSRSVMSYTFSK